jgi:hypothetical protein
MKWKRVLLLLVVGGGELASRRGARARSLEMRDLCRARISISVAPSHLRTTRGGSDASDPGAQQQRADHHFHSREPAGKLVLVRPERAAKNQETPDDLEHGTADAERTESKWHDRTLSHDARTPLSVRNIARESVQSCERRSAWDPRKSRNSKIAGRDAWGGDGQTPRA